MSQVITSADLNAFTVDAYIAMIAAGWQPPPIIVCHRADGMFAVLDGNHRAAAARRLGRREIATIEVAAPPLR